MKKPLCLFAFLLAGCSHYVTLHKQEPLVVGNEKLPIAAGLYIPKYIQEDSLINFDLGGSWNWLHPNHVRVENEIVNSIKFAAKSSVRNLVLLDSFPTPKKIASSLDFIIVPHMQSMNIRFWVSSLTLFKSFYTITAESKINVEIFDNQENLLELDTINALGVSGRKLDSVGTIDSVVADAMDSALQNLQAQFIYCLTTNKSFRASPPPDLSALQAKQFFHRYYGTESKFELDTISYELTTIPNERRWSEWGDLLSWYSSQPMYLFFHFR